MLFMLMIMSSVYMLKIPYWENIPALSTFFIAQVSPCQFKALSTQSSYLKYVRNVCHALQTEG